MKLRRRIVLTAAALLLGLGLIATGVAVWLLKTDAGTRFVQRRITSAIAGAVKTRSYIGNLSGTILGNPTIDSLVIWDSDDSVLVATGPVTFEFDLLELWDKRISLRNVVVERPRFHLRRLDDGRWNYKSAFGSDSGPSLPQAPGTHFGDVVLLESVEIRDGEFRWTEPWAPARWLRGNARDSVIRWNLARTDADVKRVGGTLYRTRYWRNLQLVAPYIRVRDPSSPGFAVNFARLDVDENDPPFIVRDARGSVSVERDTVRVAIHAFRLPGSSGRARGMLFTKDGLGVAMQVVGDTVSLSDIAWLYPTLPREGGGAMVLDIRKARTSDHIDYALSRIDVTSTHSRLRGDMTFGVGEEILALTDVDLELDPVDFRLIEAFNGAPLTLPWAGQLRGHVRARGGPLNAFFVDTADVRFADANVAGVVNHFSGRGTLDIVRPINTTFHDFSAQVHHFDLRTARALDSMFPPLEGWVYGTANLDSIWTDVRFRNANFVYAVDSTLRNRFTGDGRVTVGEVEMSYDVALRADSVRLESFALSYPNFALRGTFSGPFTVQGSLGALALTGDLTGEGGRVRTSNLVIDGLEPGLGVTGSIDFTTIDPSRVLLDPPAWSARLTGSAEAALTGDSIATLDGGLRLRFTQSTIAGARVENAYTAMTLGNGLVRVDSLTIAADGIAANGRGGLGLRAGESDSLRLSVEIDSLGALRQFLAPVVDSMPVDSLKGRFTGTLNLAGNIDSLSLRGSINGTNVAYGTTSAASMDVGLDLLDITRQMTGSATMTSRSMTAAGIRFSEMLAEARFLGGDTARVVAHLESETGPAIDAGGHVAWDTLEMRTLLDSLQIAIDERRWRLTRPARIVATQHEVTFDTLDMRAGDNARLSFAANIPESGEMAGRFRADAFPLSDIGKLFQAPVPLSGVAAVEMTLSGTRDAPLMAFGLHAVDAGLGATRVEGLRLTGDYRDRSLNAQLEYSSGGAVVMRGDAALPLNLAFRPVARRVLDTPIRATLEADSTDLGVLRTFWSGIQDASGLLDVRLTAEGTWNDPRVSGFFRVHDGSVLLQNVGVRYSGITAGIRFIGDSIQVDTLIAQTAPQGTISISGNGSFANLDNPSFLVRVRANDFHAINNPDLANLRITTDPVRGMRLTGNKLASVLTGGIIADGSIYMSDNLTRKDIIDLTDPAFQDVIAPTDTAIRRLLPPAPPAILENMSVQQFTIAAGENLTLRSAEANIQLGGELGLDVSRGTRGRRTLELAGTLTALGGTYRAGAGLLQRTFTVEGGEIRFYGDPEINPELNIRALYTVRQLDQRDARQDVRIRATLGGTLTQPLVTLSSADANARLSNNDLISYLTIGAPSFEVGGRASDYANAVTTGLLTTGASAIGGALGGVAFCDVVDIRTATVGAFSGVGQTGRNILAGTRVGCARQFTNDLLLRVDVGFCQLTQQVNDIANSLGLKVEQRFPNNISAAAGWEPPTAALLCTQAAAARGFVFAPGQFTIDVFRRWRW